MLLMNSTVNESDFDKACSGMLHCQRLRLFMQYTTPGIYKVSSYLVAYDNNLDLNQQCTLLMAMQNMPK